MRLGSSLATFDVILRSWNELFCFPAVPAFIEQPRRPTVARTGLATCTGPDMCLKTAMEPSSAEPLVRGGCVLQDGRRTSGDMNK